MRVTWPLGNDAEQYQRCFLDDGTGENEKSLGEAFQSRKVEGACGTEGVSELFPLQLCLGDSSKCWCDLFMAWGRQAALLEEK